MHLVHEVVFDYKLTNGASFPVCADFSNIQELKDAIGKFASYDTPTVVRVSRIVKIMDTDFPIPYANRNPFSADKYKTLKFDDESIDFIVADKLVYPYDVRVLLTKKYGSILDLEIGKLKNNIPVLYSGVTEYHHYGLKDDNGRSTMQSIRHVNCRSLTDKDIVLDKNLCQIWPSKPKNPLSALEKFLHKTKEIVH